MTPQTYVRFASPVTVRMSVPASRYGPERSPVERTFPALQIQVQLDAARREIRACLPPIPGTILLYGPVDFSAAASDTMDDHSERVLKLLGSDPAAALQALIDGAQLPDPPQRVPREVANWRIKFILDRKGLIARIQPMIDAMPERDRAAANYAWNGDAKCARASAMVQAIGQALGLDAAAMDALFIQAESIPT